MSDRDRVSDVIVDSGSGRAFPGLGGSDITVKGVVTSS